MAAPAPAFPQKTSTTGLVYGGIGYFLWGISPIYFKVTGFVGALEMTAHRAIWSFLLLLAMMPALGRLPALRQILANRRLRAVCCLTSFLLMWNWLLFVYLVESNQVLAGSLAYYMVPLWSVLLGRFFLKEAVSRLQWCALALAGAGVLVLMLAADAGIWLALLVSLSWTPYALLRKRFPTDGIACLGFEIGLATPLAVAFLLFLATQGRGILVQGSGAEISIILLAAPVTVLPLIAFAAGQRRLSFAMMGLMQYMVPTMQFLLAVLLWHEPVTRHHLVALPCIWAALAIYMWTSLRRAGPSR